ncbi:hypothetical protein ACA910_008663 [Epithemia clementina (nom. ined.)]
MMGMEDFRVARFGLVVGLVFSLCAHQAIPFTLSPQSTWRPRWAILTRNVSPVSHEELSLSVSEIKKELKERGVSFADCFDKESLVVRLKESRMNDGSGDANLDVNIPVDSDDANSNTNTKKNDSSILEEVRSMTVRQLREELARRNQRWGSLIEKEDLVQAVCRARTKAAEFSATGAIAPGEVADLTGEQLVAELAKTDTPLLLDAYAVWCGPCQMMAPQLVEVAKALGDRVRVAKMDTDKHPEQASKLKVQGLPTLILYVNGNERDRIEGALMKDQLLGWINSKL